MQLGDEIYFNKLIRIDVRLTKLSTKLVNTHTTGTVHAI
jgi:hypothetical protein